MELIMMKGAFKPMIGRKIMAHQAELFAE